MLDKLITEERLLPLFADIEGKNKIICVYSHNGHGRTLLSTNITHEVIRDLTKRNQENNASDAVVIFDDESSITELANRNLYGFGKVCRVDIVQPDLMNCNRLDKFIELLQHTLNGPTKYRYVMIDLPAISGTFGIDGQQFTETRYFDELRRIVEAKDITIVVTVPRRGRPPFKGLEVPLYDTQHPKSSEEDLYDFLEGTVMDNKDPFYYPVSCGWPQGIDNEMMVVTTSEKWYVDTKWLFDNVGLPTDKADPWNLSNLKMEE